MAVSLGMRVSGLLVVGAVAVAVAAFTGGGSGTPDGGGGHGAIVTVGPSDSARSPASPLPPAPRQSPAGQAGPTALPSTPGHTQRTTASPAGASPTPSPTHGNSLLLSPAWLPPGPVSPDADHTPDPSGVYDGLRNPGQCRAAHDLVPAASADPEWRVIRALATACLAVQGRGGSWDSAAEAYAGLSGKADTCKGRAGYAVLGGLLDFHRRHPGATVRLRASGGTPACAYRVAGVDTGGDGEAQPGETVAVELRDLCFDPSELLRSGSVFIDGRQLAGPPVLRSQAGDRLVLSAVVPSLAGYPRPVDVVVRYGTTEARLKHAFTVVAPAALPSPGVPSGSPQRVLPLGPLPAHLPGP
ncbi:hypothetical protein [Streptomyces sp. NBC_01530]|uniref:hypothetical protein n=1 Tax=Streptomyces sp. NBC_01530 TaxID=2903895 RepID=UPI0038645FE7